MIIPGKEISNFNSDRYAVDYKKATVLMENVDHRADDLHWGLNNLSQSPDTVIVADCRGYDRHHIISGFAKFDPHGLPTPPKSDDDWAVVKTWTVKNMNVRERGVLGSENYSLRNNDTTTVYKHSHLGLCHEVAIDKQSGDMTISHSFLGIKW